MTFAERVRNILGSTEPTDLTCNALETLRRLRDFDPNPQEVHILKATPAIIKAREERAQFVKEVLETDLATLAAAWLLEYTSRDPYSAPHVIKEVLEQPGGGKIYKAVVSDNVATKDGVA